MADTRLRDRLPAALRDRLDPPNLGGRSVRRRRLEAAGIVLLGLLTVLLLAGAVLAYDVVTVRREIEQARVQLGAGLGALSGGEVETTVERFRRSGRHVERARSVTNETPWRIAERLPVLEQSFATVRKAVAVADEGTTVATRIVDNLGRLTGDGGVRGPDGSIDLTPVKRAAEDIRKIDTHPLAAALEDLAGPPPRQALGGVRFARAQTLEVGRRLLRFTHQARSTAAIVPSFLGAEEPREYFLAMQNSAELRGTGGLIGFFATLRVDKGQLSLGDPERYDVLDEDAPTGEAGSGADDLPEEFVERYESNQSTTFLANANLDPDLPTVSKVLLNIYEAQRGKRLDGVIALDPIGLAFAHAAVGDVRLPDDVLTGGLPNPLPPSRLARVLMVDAYDALGGESQARRDYLEVVAESAFRGIASGDWNAITMLQRLGQAAAGGHLQVYSADPEEQEVFTSLGVAGQLEQPPGMDFLAVTANNSAGNKSDAHVAHRWKATLRLVGSDAESLRRRGDLRLAVTNPLDVTGHDIYIVGSSNPSEGFTNAFAGPRGLNRTWFTFWAPGTTRSIDLTNANGRERPDPDVDELHGLKAVDYVLETPSKSTRSFRVRWRGPVEAATAPNGDLVYVLRLHRQAKAIPDRLDVTVVPPDGWTVSRAVATGGGAGPGMGPDGAPGPPVRAEIADGAVRVQGDMTDDVTVEVRLTRGDDAG